MNEIADQKPWNRVIAGVGPVSVLSWLRAGWRDFCQAPWIGLFFGACFAFMGLALVWLMQWSAGWALALSAGFLLLGPFLCCGLYDVSRSLQAGEKPTWGNAIMAWDGRVGALLPYLGGLLVVELLWSRSAMVVFAVSFSSITPQGGPLEIVLDPDNISFVLTYIAVGAIFAGVIFVTSVVSIPLILDTDADGISAVLTSARVCAVNPGAMLFWGAVITLLTVLAMLPLFAGLLVAGPVIGHASWHAYRETVGAV
jgi:uncharacterized membrane protein